MLIDNGSRFKNVLAFAATAFALAQLYPDDTAIPNNKKTESVTAPAPAPAPAPAK